MWHCPHCGAPQAEAARCWVCHKSSTTCSTCRHFRGSLSADVGWCALDPKRKPLTGREQRGCWQERTSPALATIPETEERAGRRPRRQALDDAAESAAAAVLDFIPVELLRPVVIPTAPSLSRSEPVEPAMQPGLPHPASEADESWAERTSLFGELEA